MSVQIIDSFVDIYVYIFFNSLYILDTNPLTEVSLRFSSIL